MMLGAWRCSGHEIAGVIDCRVDSRPDWPVDDKAWSQTQTLARLSCHHRNQATLQQRTKSVPSLSPITNGSLASPNMCAVGYGVGVMCHSCIICTSPANRDAEF
jgi:hypothetical protein